MNDSIQPDQSGSPAGETPPLIDVLSCARDDVSQVFRQWNEPQYRVGQLFHWLYRQKACEWSAMTNLPLPLRQKLAHHYILNTPHLLTVANATDGTRKFLWQLPDKALIESVLIHATPALYGESSDRLSLCVSTQVGCAYGCRFCASGLDGWKRNLLPSEIVGQVLAAERWLATRPAPAEIPAGNWGGVEHARHIDNLIIMGMGEPLANYDPLLQALRIINARWGLGIGARKITISTCGLAPEIRKLAREPFQFRLAISLHAATDDVRGRLMPVNRKYPLAELKSACHDYLKLKGRMITFEYVLIAGVNDTRTQAEGLARMARELHAWVNLIPYNSVEGLPWERPSESAQDEFLSRLSSEGIKVTLRREKGLGIDAACGQLRLRTERAGSQWLAANNTG